MSFDHILRALSWRRYLLSSWPWRALAYVYTTCLLLPIIGVGTAMLALPWAAAIGRLSNDGTLDLGLLPWLISSALIAVTIGPLVAMPLAALERQRLGIVDKRPIVSSRSALTTGPLLGRYLSSAVWHELAYLLLLAIVAPLVYGALAVLVFLDLFMIASPAITLAADEPVTLGFGEADVVWEALPVAILGLAMVPLIGYLLGLLSGGHAVLARAMLTDTGANALREVTRSRARLLDAFDAERRRIERDLHDGAQHRLTSLTLQLAVARLDVTGGSPAAPALDKAHDQAKELMVVLRDLIHGIRPQVLTELGLPAAVAELAGELAVPVTVTNLLGGQRLAETLESTAYFAVSEALVNVAKHSRATRAAVRLSTQSGKVVVEVSDDGRGGADPAKGSGLTGLADRVAAGNGRLLLSSPPGGPPLVRVELPWSR